MHADRRLFATLAAAAALLAAAAPRAQAPTQTAQAAWSAEQQARATAWAQQFVDRLRNEEFDEAVGLGVFDHEAITDAALEGVDCGDARTQALFRDGIVKGMKENDATLFEQWRAGQPTFKRVLLVDGRPVARLRISGDDGVSLLDLVIVPRGDSFCAVDLRNHATGMSIVESLRQNALVLLPGVDAGALSRLFGAGKAARADADHLRAMMKHRQAGDHASAVAEYAKLTEAMQATAAATAVHIECLGMLADQEAYAAALEQAAKRHPAPKFRLMLLDAHFVRERWDDAIACVDEFMKAVERDAALLALRALLEQRAGHLDRAQRDLREALTLEPDCEYALSSGLDVWLAAGDWARVRAAIVALEEHHGYAFQGNLQGDAWAGFLAAPESGPWR